MSLLQLLYRSVASFPSVTLDHGQAFDVLIDIF